MKKKYLAYVLSAAMLTSMMPTSVYAEVIGTGVDTPVVSAAAGKTTNSSANVTITAGTNITSEQKVKYSDTKNEVQFNVAITQGDEATNANNVTVNVYKANIQGDVKEGDILKSSNSTNLVSVDKNGKKADNVAVDVAKLPVGKYIAYAVTDRAETPDESQKGLAFEIAKADAPTLSWKQDFNPSEIPYTGDVVQITGLDTAVEKVPAGETSSFVYYKSNGQEQTDNGTDGASGSGQAPKNAGQYQLEGKVAGKNYNDATVKVKKSFNIAKVAPTSIKIAETNISGSNEVDLVQNANAEIILAKGTTDLKTTVNACPQTDFRYFTGFAGLCWKRIFWMHPRNFGKAPADRFL